MVKNFTPPLSLSLFLGAASVSQVSNFLKVYFKDQIIVKFHIGREGFKSTFGLQTGDLKTKVTHNTTISRKCFSLLIVEEKIPIEG